MNHAPAILAASTLIYSTHRVFVVWIIVAHFHLCSLLGTVSRCTVLKVQRSMRVCCGSLWGRCVVLIIILDSFAWCIIQPCIQYTASVAGKYGQCMVHTLAGTAGVASAWFIRIPILSCSLQLQARPAAL